MLLNTVLTVEKGNAGSHQNRGWETFTSKVLDVVDRYGGANLGNKGGFGAGRGRGIVFLAWGAPAAKCVAKLDTVSASAYLTCRVYSTRLRARWNTTEETPHLEECCEFALPHLC